MAKNAEATVNVAGKPCGLFAAGVCCSGSMHRFGYVPSIWCEPYATREAARRAGIEEILAYMDDPTLPDNKTATEEIRRVRRQLEGEIVAETADAV